LADPQLGRYSYLTADPVAWFAGRTSPSQPFAELPTLVDQFATPRVADLPPFQGGLAGLMAYEFGQTFERLPTAEFNPLQMPDLAFGLYDWVLCWDATQSRGWLISQGLPETSLVRRKARSCERADQIMELISNSHAAVSAADEFESPSQTLDFPPQFLLPQVDGLSSNFDRDGYLAAVRRAIEYIRAGDIFQVNLSQQLRLPARASAATLYSHLRRDNASTFAAFLDLGDTQIISASPERLLAADRGRLETRPIKGTRRRTGQPVVDLAAAEELAQSRKDRAENAMIVDLVRNDFSRVCNDESVQVRQFCELERYRSVLHLVSSVTGHLRKGLNVWDALAAIFPGGSVTGCPKIRSMEIITELERTARGAYCGSIGYVGLDQQADFNLLIRTITASKGWWQFPVGGAVVAESDPELEYEETWVKAAGLLQACRKANSLHPNSAHKPSTGLHSTVP
jgi:para-aminobenzoate synthetase component 1